MTDDISALKEDEKQQNAAPRRDHGGNWIGGLILIAIGLVFLAQNLFQFRLDNWWALFILIPAAITLGRAWQSYRQFGRLTEAGRGSLIGGLLMATVGGIFLFDLDWGKVWPVFIIIAGFGALLSGVLRD